MRPMAARFLSEMKFGYAVFGFTAVVQAEASACPDQARIGAHDLVPFSYGKAGSGAWWGMPHRRSILECSTLPPCRLRVHSRPTIPLRSVWRARGFLASPSAKNVRRDHLRLGQCPFHRRESVDAEIRHKCLPSRYVRPVRGGKHFVTTLSQCGISRPEESDAQLVAHLLRTRHTLLKDR